MVIWMSIWCWYLNSDPAKWFPFFYQSHARFYLYLNLYLLISLLLLRGRSVARLFGCLHTSFRSGSGIQNVTFNLKCQFSLGITHNYVLCCLFCTMSVHLNLYLYRKPNKGILFRYTKPKMVHYQIKEQNNIWIMHNKVARFSRTNSTQTSSITNTNAFIWTHTHARAPARTHSSKSQSTDETKLLCARYNIIKRTKSTESI